jgi:hypothetical protein
MQNKRTKNDAEVGVSLRTPRETPPTVENSGKKRATQTRIQSRNSLDPLALSAVIETATYGLGNRRSTGER